MSDFTHQCFDCGLGYNKPRNLTAQEAREDWERMHDLMHDQIKQKWINVARENGIATIYTPEFGEPNAE